MGWFDEQIRQRKQNDDDVFADSFVNMAAAVLGSKVTGSLSDGSAAAKSSIDEILKYYHVKSREVPDNIKDTNEQLEYLMRPYGIMRRTVRLEKGWYRDAVGAMLGVMKESGRVVALIPAGFSGYCYIDPDSGKKIKINRRNQRLFDSEAIAFYKPFPLKKIGLGSVAKYIAETLSAADFALIALATLALSLIGMLSPKLNNILFAAVLPSGSVRLLLSIAVFTVSVSVSSLLISATKEMITARINTKMSVSVQAAAMMRIMSLLADFFKGYGSGDLSSRAAHISSLCNMLVSAVLTTGLTSAFSLIYISQIFIYAPVLVAPAIAVILATVAFSLISSFAQMRISKKQMELSAKESGMSYALISGIQKIKLAGAEKRAFARWGNLYAQNAKLTYNPPAFIKLNSVISLAISLIGNIVMYAAAVKSGVSVADYYAFGTAYGMVSGAFMSLAGMALTVAQIKPILETVQPFF